MIKGRERVNDEHNIGYVYFETPYKCGGGRVGIGNTWINLYEAYELHTIIVGLSPKQQTCPFPLPQGSLASNSKILSLPRAVRASHQKNGAD